MSNITFNDTPTELPPAMTGSLFAIPYKIHKDSPIIKVMINHVETSSIRLVVISLIIWDIVLQTENILADIPIIDIIKILNMPITSLFKLLNSYGF